MTILRAFGAMLRRRSDSQLAEDIVAAGNAARQQHGQDPITPSPVSSQGVRPYGFGY